MPVHGARCKVQNIAQVIHNRNTRILQYGRFFVYSYYSRIIIIHSCPAPVMINITFNLHGVVKYIRFQVSLKCTNFDINTNIFYEFHSK